MELINPPEIIPLKPILRFCVYEHKMHANGELSSFRMIVLKNIEGRIACFTGLENFAYPYTGQKPKIAVRSKTELVYICLALNYIFSHNQVQKIADITPQMVFDFFNSYCTAPRGRSDEIMRSQQSLDNCVRRVSSFFCNLAAAYQTKISVEDLMVYEDTKANRHSHRIIRRYHPRYVPKRPHSWDTKLLRDMPLTAAFRLVELALIHDPMIAFGIVLQLSAGLRPSCVTNMRQNGSPVSSTPCIRISYRGSGVSNVEIDLTHEYVLRSDAVNVGKIKKERVVTVYKAFLPVFMNSYTLHQQILANTPCEEQYMPMFIGRNGKAMTYNSYASRVKKLVYKHLKPELYYSDDPQLSAFAHLLDSYRWAPHTLRHCFTVWLVSKGLDVAQVQYYRGDSSPESAITYVAGKGELMKQVASAHQGALEKLSEIY